MATDNGTSVHPDTPDWFKGWLDSGFARFVSENRDEHSVLAKNVLKLYDRDGVLHEVALNLNRSNGLLTDAITALMGRTGSLEQVLPQILETLTEIRDGLRKA